jgi:PTH2 family peptidyl-tRNA hydrolase
MVRLMTPELRRGFEDALRAKGLPILATDQYYQITVIARKDLDMRNGKFAAQVAHAVVYADRHSQFFDAGQAQRAWDESNQRVVVLKVHSKEELFAQKAKAEANDLPVSVMVDAGLTQIEPHTATCIAVGPAPIERLDALFRDLKLY